MIDYAGILFSPIKIGSTTIKNRFVMPAMGTSLGSYKGDVTNELIAYYRERARGEVGLLITESLSVHPSGRTSGFMLNLEEDRYVEGIKRLVSEVHHHGAKIFLQLNHGGRQTSSRITGMPIVAPSPIPCPLIREMPQQLSKKQILELIQAFIQAAYRAKQSGADGVELHMAHGYLICEFLSKCSNDRIDEYGGTLENRVRFARQIVEGIKAMNGHLYPVICRISADEMIGTGITIEESIKIVRELEQTGADAIHVSACNYESYFYNMPCYYLDEGCFIHLAHEIKKVVNIPVIAVGRIRSSVMASQIIRQRKADLIAMGRSLIADPQLPNKTQAGGIETIRPCLSCNQCFQSMVSGKLTCAVNPSIGQVKKNRGRLEGKKILVIGGGVAGLESARAIAIRGADVTLYEERRILGGQLSFSSLLPHKAHYREMISYYQYELGRLNVRCNLGIKWDAGLIDLRPNAIIVATGSEIRLQDVDVINDENIIQYEKALQYPEQTGGNIVIIGGGMIGIDLADFFSSLGRNVTIIEKKNKIGSSLPGFIRYHVMKLLVSRGVTILIKRKVFRIKNGSVYLSTENADTEIMSFDTIIPAASRVSKNDLVADLKNRHFLVYGVGDALSVGNIKSAIAGGFLFGGCMNLKEVRKNHDRK